MVCGLNNIIVVHVNPLFRIEKYEYKVFFFLHNGHHVRLRNHSGIYSGHRTTPTSSLTPSRVIVDEGEETVSRGYGRNVQKRVGKAFGKPSVRDVVHHSRRHIASVTVNRP